MDLVHLKEMRTLLRLGLAGTQVSDAGLEIIKGMKARLVNLELAGTKVTAAGAQALQKALPNCKILHESISDTIDPGTPAPAKVPLNAEPSTAP